MLLRCRCMSPRSTFSISARHAASFSTAFENEPNSSRIYNAPLRGPPQRPPTDTAFYTGNPDYFRILRQVNEIIRVNNLRFNKGAMKDKVLPRWMSIDELRSLRKFQLTYGMYRDLITKLNILYTAQEKDGEIVKLLGQCIKPGEVLQAKSVEREKLDALGRSHTLGSRKSAKAQCWMVPGQGQIYVNGVELASYFNQLSDREKVVKPLEVANGLGSYNIWSVVAGGGSTGQADALAVAVARGLVTHDPLCESQFQKLGLTTIDRRQVERKKTGQPKARKKNTWVKR